MKRTHSQSVIKENVVVKANVSAASVSAAVKPTALYVIPPRRIAFFEPKVTAKEMLNAAVNNHNQGYFARAIECAQDSLALERSAKAEMLIKLCQKALTPSQNRVSFTE